MALWLYLTIMTVYICQYEPYMYNYIEQYLAFLLKKNKYVTRIYQFYKQNLLWINK